MKKTSVYLDPEVDEGLARLAAIEGVTKAELIRRSLARTAQRASRPRLTAIGVGHGPGDVADDVDQYLSDSGFGNR